MAQNDQNGDEQEQGEGYQDPNEQEALDSRSDSIGSEPLTAETGTPQGESLDDDDEDLDDLDELDEDRDDDQRESGPNRRFNIG